MSLFPTPLRDLTEKQFEIQLVGTADHPGVARQLGYRVYHTLRSKGSAPGWPDWALARERLIMLELKSETGTVSDHQKVWLRALKAAEVEVYVVRPRHLEMITAVLAARANPRQVYGPATNAAVALTATTDEEIA